MGIRARVRELEATVRRHEQLFTAVKDLLPPEVVFPADWDEQMAALDKERPRKAMEAEVDG